MTLFIYKKIVVNLLNMYYNRLGLKKESDIMYEIIVVGGGHAGCEASLASARKGHKTLLVTGNIKNIADMP